jgi:oligopeptide/dipeptide ABC transporter ATP-binding protein
MMSNHNVPILRVEGLKKYFPVRKGFLQRICGWIKAVENVSFQIQRGQTLGLVGESGCGKTTVARLILKLSEADEGAIVFGGENLVDLSEKEMKPMRQQIQMIFQDPYGSLNPKMTIGQSVAEGLRVVGIRPGPEQQKRVARLLKMVGMSATTADRYPHEFSGGQRQRVGIARALSVEPSVIICDEPVSALDVSIQAQILNLLKDLQDELGLSYLFISHDLNVVGYLCSDVAVMYKGYIMEYASADELFDNPCHPYTHLLLSAASAISVQEQFGMTEIANEVPEILTEPAGCSFHSKCTSSDHRCRTIKPEFKKVGQNHFVRCWNVAKTGTQNFYTATGEKPR